MSDKAVLSFRYWHTGAAVLSICIVKSISFDVIDCQSIGSVSSEHVYVDIPQMEETIRIALRADSIMGEGIIAIDDLKLEVKETTHDDCNFYVIFSRENFVQPSHIRQTLAWAQQKFEGLALEIFKVLQILMFVGCFHVTLIKKIYAFMNPNGLPAV